jgi:DNA-binding transcriptional regulator YhcF (GntR family)
MPNQKRSIKIGRMKFWFARGTEVTLREQLVTQTILGILCGDLVPGQRLPSTREIARSFRLHPNTVSAGYRQLERENWLELRHGSGVYVRDTRSVLSASSPVELDRLIANFFRSARRLGTPLPAVRSRLRRWLASQPPDHFLLIEPDEELRKIVMAEMKQVVTFPVKGCGLGRRNLAALRGDCIPVALPSQTGIVQEALPARAELITLGIRSIPDSLAKWLPAPQGALVGIVSRWPGFLKSARTLLIAAGFNADQLVFRDSRKPDWRRGLMDADAIVCDSLTAAGLRRKPQLVVFPILSQSSLDELRNYEAFVSKPGSAPVRRP